MSGAKDRREAARTGVVHRSGVRVKQDKCAFPRCSNNAWPKSQFGLCQTCDYVIHLVAWFDKLMEASQEQEHTGKRAVLFIPKPGMENEAIRQAIDKAKSGGG